MNILNGSINPNPLLDADKILHNDLLRGIITIPYRSNYSFGQETSDAEIIQKSIPFYMTSNFSFNLSNEWGELLPISEMEGLTNFLNLFSASPWLTHENSRQGNLQSKIGSTKVWKKSTLSDFKIDTIFVSTDRSINPLEIVKALAAGALPSEGNATLQNLADDLMYKAASNISNFLTLGTYDITTNEGYKKVANKVGEVLEHVGMTAPFGYRAEFTAEGWKSTPKNTCSLKIGKWFHATQLVVTSISNIELSKEVVKKPTKLSSNRNYAYPLYAKCTIGFAPYTIVTASDFAKYFTTPKYTG